MSKVEDFQVQHTAVPIFLDTTMIVCKKTIFFTSGGIWGGYEYCGYGYTSFGSGLDCNGCGDTFCTGYGYGIASSSGFFNCSG